MKYIICLMLWLYVGVHVGLGQARYEKYFLRGEVLRMADSSVLEINTGCCGAMMRDVNGDGVDDLLIGEFGEVKCPGDPSINKPFVEGRCRAYINHGTRERPVYRDYTWLQAAGKPLYVPITCCVPFMPAYADLDGDGVDELLSGCYTGEIYRWKQEDTGQYVAQDVIRLTDGSPIKVGAAVTVYPVDANGDGKIDLLMTSLYEGIFIAYNTGNDRVYRFERVEAILNHAGEKIMANHAVMYDWDGDGVLDLVYGDYFDGSVYWCKGLGKLAFAEREFLVECTDDMRSNMAPGEVHGNKPKICIYDYDGDGKDDLVLATEVWLTTGGEMTAEIFEKAMNDERCIKIGKRVKALEKRMLKYTGRLPENENDTPDPKIPKKLYEEWLSAQESASSLMSRVMKELTETTTRLAGNVWVYYRK